MHGKKMSFYKSDKYIDLIHKSIFSYANSKTVKRKPWSTPYLREDRTCAQASKMGNKESTDQSMRALGGMFRKGGALKKRAMRASVGQAPVGHPSGHRPAGYAEAKLGLDYMERVIGKTSYFQMLTPSILDPSCQVLLLSGGSRRAPTPASTSTRLASPSWYCDIGNVFPVHLRLNFDMQELPIELKEDYLRRANLLMHSPDAPGQPSGGPAQVGSHPGGPAQVGHGIWWDSVGHAPGQPSAGHAQVGHPAQRPSVGGRPTQGGWYPGWGGRVSKKRGFGKTPMGRARVGHAVGSGHCSGQSTVGQSAGQVERPLS